MKHLIVLIVALGLAACQPAESTNSPTAAASDDNSKTLLTVNDQKVTDDLVKYYGKARFGTETLSEEQQETVIEDITQLYALVSEAKRQGLDKDPETRARMQMQSHSMLAQLVMQNFAENNQVTDEAVKAAYDSDSAGTEFKARHILLKEESEAVAVIAELDGGADFAELATTKSVGPSAAGGGDLGWFPAAQMVAPFAEALPGIETGTYSKTPVQTQFGWHVILVEETRKQGFDQVKAQIKEKLTNDQVKNFLEGLKTSAKVVKTP